MAFTVHSSVTKSIAPRVSCNITREVGDDFELMMMKQSPNLTQLTQHMQLTQLNAIKRNSTRLVQLNAILHSNASHASWRSIPTSLTTINWSLNAIKLFLSATLSNTKHICNSFCHINQTNWLLANTLIGLTNCEIEEKPKETFEPGKEADFYPSVQMTKSRKSQGILWHIWGNGE